MRTKWENHILVEVRKTCLKIRVLLFFLKRYYFNTLHGGGPVWESQTRSKSNKLLIDRCASLKIHIFTPSDPDCEIRKGAMIMETFN